MSFPRRVSIGFDTTLLTNGSSINSDAIPCTSYKMIRGIVFSDQASVLNGLVIEQSVDGGNNYDISNKYSIVANTALKIDDIKLYGTHFKVSYTNGAVTQTVFRASIQMVV